MKERSRLNPVTRRTFLASAGITACTGIGAAAFPRIASGQAHPDRVERGPALLHAAVNFGSGGASIQTFAIDGGRCTRVADALCASFTALAMHPSLPVLYAAGDTAPGQPLPHGHIEAFQIDSRSGRLHSIARAAMSLSATGPRSLTVSPDGTRLLVAAGSGGIWNSFPLDTLGIPAQTPIARKEIGSHAAYAGQAAAHPHSIVYPRNARLAIATDTGSNQVSLMEPSVQDIAVHARYLAKPAAGPAYAALFADHSHLLIASILDPSLSLWQITGSYAAPSLRHVSATPTSTPITALLANPASSIAYSARPEARGSRLDIWHLAGDPHHGRSTSDTGPGQKHVSLSGTKDLLSCTHTAPLPFSSATALFHHNGQLWAATSEGILRLKLDTQGYLQQASLSTRLPGLATIALQTYALS